MGRPEETPRAPVPGRENGHAPEGREPAPAGGRRKRFGPEFIPLNLSAPFIRRPVATTLLTIAVTLAGMVAFFLLPVAPLPEVDFPVVRVQANMPGASPETMAATVATPLERALGRIAGVTEMTSSSSLGSTRIILQFDLDRDINGAARDVQAAINAARSTLPTMPSNPTYRKVNPSGAPILILSVTSDVLSRTQLYDAASTVLAQKISQIAGVGEVTVGGGALPAVRVDISPDALHRTGLSMEDVRAALAGANAFLPKGHLENEDTSWTVVASDQLRTAAQYRKVIVAERDGVTIRLGDVATVTDSSQDIRQMALSNGKPSILLIVFRSPGANIIETVDRVKAMIPQLRSWLPESADLSVRMDRSQTIRASLHEVEKSLLLSMALVVLVVFLFLRNGRATSIPAVAAPVSLIGTFGVMYLCGYTLDNLSLMALTVATGFVVDDAIVVLENVERIMSTEHLPPKEATAKAMSEVTAPVIAIVLVLCAVFIPVSFMGGLAGQMYKQFAITISVSVVLSGIVALTLTPALCSLLLKPHAHDHQPARPFVIFNYFFGKTTHRYVRAVRFIKDHGLVSMVLFGCMIASLVFLFRVVPSGLVPNEDQGYILGMTILDDGAVQNRTRDVTRVVVDTLRKNPVVETVMTLNGLDITSMSTKSNYGTFFAVLKPWSERKTPESSADAISAKVLGVTMMQPEAVTIGFTPPPISGMSTTGGFEGYIQMRGDGTIYDLENTANAFVAEATSRDENGRPKYPAIGSLRSLFSTGAPQLYANLDRERCKDMGISISDVFTAMNATFGALYVNDFNYLGRTFQVRLQAEADYRVLPESLHDVYVRTSKGDMVPLDAIMTLERRTAPQTMERYNVFPAAHLMGEPAAGYSSGQALEAMEQVAANMLSSDYGLGWVGSALQEKLASADTTIIFVLALVMVFLILAAQYESWSLPLAVLTAVPFGVFGALVATWLRGLSNDVYFQVALVTLVGLAAKNAILIVEFAVEAWRGGRSLDVAAMHAARLRFRPIVMTSLAFILGCVPLAISSGAGANSRHAIGTAVVGGMLAATCIATLFVPYFFRSIMRISLKLQGKKDPNEGKKSFDEEEDI